VETGRVFLSKKIDRIVTVQADNGSAWDKPIRVWKDKPVSLSISAELTARAAFLAQIYRTKSVEEWLPQVIQERVELEEAAFVGVKQELAKAD